MNGNAALHTENQSYQSPRQGSIRHCSLTRLVTGAPSSSPTPTLVPLVLCVKMNAASWMKPVILLVAVVLLTACSPYLRGPRSGAGPGKAGPLPTSPEAETLDRHLAALEAQIAKLERDLGKGRGAYRDGSLLRVEGKQGGEPPLDRLRRLERELADAEARIAARDQRVTELTRELTTARDQGRSLSEQAGDLAYAKDALVTAQQALIEARSKADGLLAQLTASELQRLKAEREQFRFAAKLLKLVPGQTTQLLELQDEARESARALDGRSEDRPHAKPASAAAPAAHAEGKH